MRNNKGKSLAIGGGLLAILAYKIFTKYHPSSKIDFQKWYSRLTGRSGPKKGLGGEKNETGTTEYKIEAKLQKNDEKTRAIIEKKVTKQLVSEHQLGKFKVVMNSDGTITTYKINSEKEKENTENQLVVTSDDPFSLQKNKIDMQMFPSGEKNNPIIAVAEFIPHINQNFNKKTVVQALNNDETMIIKEPVEEPALYSKYSSNLSALGSQQVKEKIGEINVFKFSNALLFRLFFFGMVGSIPIADDYKTFQKKIFGVVDDQGIYEEDLYKHISEDQAQGILKNMTYDELRSIPPGLFSYMNWKFFSNLTSGQMQLLSDDQLLYMELSCIANEAGAQKLSERQLRWLYAAHGYDSRLKNGFSSFMTTVGRGQLWKNILDSSYRSNQKKVAGSMQPGETEEYFLSSSYEYKKWLEILGYSAEEFPSFESEIIDGKEQFGIKARYKAMALKYHPDKICTFDESTIKKIQDLLQKNNIIPQQDDKKTFNEILATHYFQLIVDAYKSIQDAWEKSDEYRDMKKRIKNDG